MGGAILSEHSSITIINSTFLRNCALACGGALCALGSGSTVNICDSEFFNNHGSSVVHVVALGGKTTIDHSKFINNIANNLKPMPHSCLLYTSPSPRDATLSRMPSSA